MYYLKMNKLKSSLLFFSTLILSQSIFIYTYANTSPTRPLASDQLSAKDIVQADNECKTCCGEVLNFAIDAVTVDANLPLLAEGKKSDPSKSTDN